MKRKNGVVADTLVHFALVLTQAIGPVGCFWIDRLAASPGFIELVT